MAHISRVVKRAPIGWSHDDYDVLGEGEVVVRIMKVIAAPEDTPWIER